MCALLRENPVSTVFYVPTFLSHIPVSKATHTHIQISHKDEYIPGTRDRKVNIKGEPRAVAEAYQVIFEKVSYLMRQIFTNMVLLL